MSQSNRSVQKLYEKWQELKDDAVEDCRPINKSSLDQDFDLAGLNIKWLNILQDWIKLRIQLEQRIKQLRRELIEYYKIEYQLKFETKDELNLFVETDDRLVTLNEKYAVVKSITNYCEEVIDKIKMKSWEIKNWIEYQRFVNGN